MSEIKIGYRTLDGHDSTAYVGEEALHSGTDKYSDWPVWVVWDEALDRWREVEAPDQHVADVNASLGAKLVEQGRLLGETVLALKGPPPDGGAWAYYDLPETAARLVGAYNSLVGMGQALIEKVNEVLRMHSPTGTGYCPVCRTASPCDTVKVLIGE